MNSMNLARVSKKTPHEDNRMTLIALHEKKMKDFDEYYKQLPKKELLLKQLIRKERGNRNRNSDEMYKLRKEIKELEEEIEDMKNRSEEVEYLLQASPYLKQYSEKVEVKNDNKKVIEDDDEFDGLTSFLDMERTSNKGKLAKDFIMDCLSEGVSLGTENNEKEISLACPECKIDRMVNHKEAIAVCPECGDMIDYQDAQICNEFSEEIEVLSPFSYKKINHFKEWLSMLQARESSAPRQEVIDKLFIELKKDRVQSRDDVTPERIRRYLKKLGYNKEYEHIPAIIYKICGKPPLEISRELENELISMFEKIQAPFEKHYKRINPNRSNFLSYSYCIHKLCQLLGEHELLPSLPLLKSREKLYEQDRIWKAICNEVGWTFYPSL